MPELPEVETIARSLAPARPGRRIAGDRASLPAAAPDGRGEGARGLQGRRVLGVRRRGKMLLIACEGARTLVFHLKMTGQFLFAAARGAARQARPARRPLRGRDRTSSGSATSGNSASCFASRASPRPPAASSPALGPEPLEVGLAEFGAILRGRKGRIKSLLLDQTRIAGIGNIYADEMLFEARIHPETPASSLGRPKPSSASIAP